MKTRHFVMVPMLALSLTVAGAALADEQEMGKHEMTGTVKSVNHGTGFITVDTKEGQMRLHYPPNSIEKLKEGDKVKIYLGYSEEAK